MQMKATSTQMQTVSLITWMQTPIAMVSLMQSKAVQTAMVTVYQTILIWILTTTVSRITQKHKSVVLTQTVTALMIFMMLIRLPVLMQTATV